ncbi:hypothetical protein [Lapillicoccus jejuensis]|uniref:Uncharacterized protein n=1 Tax=Lapillicoccus jejuensis TaxID=402171 RepID=A0A542E5P4_9MICO|nr:hypothetical protein [Lapillicoccus jejuensis]TQJ10606.1 hypothetical protein FB458_3735 [Lapillicoccus jejuensis]
MGGDGFYAPMGYSGVWLVVGLVLLLAVAGWYLLVWARTRPAPPPPPPPADPPGVHVIRLREGALRRIDEIVRDVQEGRSTPRRAHQELSATVRQFVSDASGVGVTTMTLTELGRSGQPRLRPLTDTVLALYPGEFGPHDGSVADAAESARRAVTSWS